VRSGRLDSTGRLFVVDSISFSESEQSFPRIQASLVVNAYVYGDAVAPGQPPAAPPPPAATTTGTDTTQTTTTGTGPTTTTGAADPDTPPAVEPPPAGASAVGSQ
jgi:hypothetical protein